jgi:hypothetical protein
MELKYLYSLPNSLGDKIEKNKMTGACSTYGGEQGVCKVLVGKTKGKRPFGRPRRRWGLIFRWIFRKWDVEVWTGSIWLRIETGGGHL